MADDLVLDTAIRNWVLVPLSVVMVLIGILRYFVTKLTRSSQNPDKKAIKEGQAVIRARNLRSGAHLIPAKSFRSRRIYFTNEFAAQPNKAVMAIIIERELLGKEKENGPLHVPREEAQTSQAPMFQDPNMAMDTMKKNLPQMIATPLFQYLTYALVNFFFSGFVAAKIPFPLTPRFRAILQYGINLSTVDVSYVSSRSWYLLNLFGLRGFFSLILGEENATDDAQKMMQMTGGEFGFNASQSLGVEKGSLEIIQHVWALPKMEHRAKDVLKSLALLY